MSFVNKQRLRQIPGNGQTPQATQKVLNRFADTSLRCCRIGMSVRACSVFTVADPRHIALSAREGNTDRPRYSALRTYLYLVFECPSF